MAKKPKKTGAEAVQENAMNLTGHNTDKLLKEYVEFIVKQNTVMQLARRKINEKLAHAKEDGFHKTSLRTIAKQLALSDEQLNAIEQIERSTAEYKQRCRDMGLFVPLEEVEDENGEEQDAA